MTSKTFFEEIHVSESSVGHMKQKLRAMERQRDDICTQVAILQNFPNIWDMSMADWNDPKIRHLKDKYFNLCKDISDLHWEIEEITSLNNGEYDRYKARKTVYTFLDSIGDEESIHYLQSIGMNTIKLVEKVMENPKFIEETYGVIA